jgi:hypothetical protein
MRTPVHEHNRRDHAAGSPLGTRRPALRGRNDRRTGRRRGAHNGAFDEAKSAMGDEAFSALLADPQQLGGLLSYHVVPKRNDAEGLVEAGKVTELAGGDVTIGGTADAPTVTDGQGTPRTCCAATSRPRTPPCS